MINNHQGPQIYFNKFCKLAEMQGGKVISEEKDYIDAHNKLKIKCNENHEFEITLSNLNLKRWCPKCSIRKMEKYTKELINVLTNKKFEKIKPKWLLNNKGNLMEIDMYNDELKLGIEYNGIQHYKFTPMFHKTEEDFNKRVNDDKMKVKLCKENNINLISVPYNCEIKSFIIKKLEELNIPYTNINKPIIIKDDMKEKLTLIISTKSATLLSPIPDFHIDPITIKCLNTHTWTTKVKNILRGHWCPTCGFEVKEKTKEKISTKLKAYLQTDEGKENKKLSLQKRSETMKSIKEEKIATITEKKCTKCTTIKPIINYCKKSASADGYQSWCKQCTNTLKKLNNI
jgi:hypothetical protein